jgi:hypothetical protein
MPLLCGKLLLLLPPTHPQLLPPHPHLIIVCCVPVHILHHGYKRCLQGLAVRQPQERVVLLLQLLAVLQAAAWQSSCKLHMQQYSSTAVAGQG